MESVQAEHIKHQLLNILLIAREHFDKGEMGVGLALTINDLEELLEKYN
jgi:hypothetical protein